MARTRAQAATKRALKKGQRELVRKIERDEVARLRDNVKRAKEMKRKRMATFRKSIQVARGRLSEDVKKFRAKWRDWVNAEVARMRAEHQRKYELARKQAERLYSDKVQRAEAELAARKALHASVKRTEAWKREQLKRGHRTTFEKRAESDDQVRANLPPELLPVWEHFKGRVKTRVPGKTRTEAFVEWVAENQDDITAAMGDVAEREARAAFERGESEQDYLDRLEREQRRRPRKATRRVPELEPLDDAIPF